MVNVLQGGNRCRTEIHCEAKDKTNVIGNDRYSNLCRLRDQELSSAFLQSKDAFYTNHMCSVYDLLETKPFGRFLQNSVRENFAKNSRVIPIVSNIDS
jgi:hypothetical protein